MMLLAFEELFYSFTIITGITLSVILIFLMARFYKDKSLFWYILSYAFIIFSYILVYLHINVLTDPLWEKCSIIVAALAYLSLTYFSLLVKVIGKKTAYLLAIIFVVLSTLKLFIAGIAAWSMFAIQGIFVLALFILSSIRFFNLGKNRQQLLIFIFAAISLFVPVGLDTYIFDTGKDLLILPGKYMLTTLHFVLMLYLILGNLEIFKQSKRRILNIGFLSYLFLLFFTAFVYFIGIFHWARYSLSIIKGIFQRALNGFSMVTILKIPLLFSLTILVVSSVIILILLVYIINLMQRNQLIESDLVFNRQIFKNAGNPMILSQAARILEMNPAALTLLGYKEDQAREIYKKDIFYDPELIPEGEEKIQTGLKHLDGHKVECLVQSSSFISQDKKYELFILENVEQIHRELAESQFYNNILQVMLSDSSWNMRLRLLSQLMRSHFQCRELFIDLKCFEEVQTEGIIAVKWLEQSNEFYLNSHAPIETQREGEELFCVLRLGKANVNYGYLAMVFLEKEDTETLQSQLFTVAYLMTQFIEADILYNKVLVSEHNYKSLVENSLTGIFIYQEGQIQYVNNKFGLLTGYFEQDVINKLQPTDLCENSFEKKQFKAQISDILKGKKQNSVITFKSHRTDGQEAWFSVYMAGIEYKDHPAVICNMLDISQQVAATRQRKKMTDLLIKEQRMTTMRNLVRGIAHEFNNVFAIIKGYVELLQAKKNREVQDKEDLMVIADTVKRGMEIANRMHIFVKQEKLEINPIDIDTLFKNIQSSFSSIIRRSGHNIQLKLEQASAGIQVLADEFNLEHVLHNLLFNSMDAIQENGTILIKAEIRDSKVILIFEDDGIGIPESDIRFVFDPFYTTKQGEQGAGLGLYICHEVVISMNGEILLESELGKFTRITIILPAAQNA